MARAKRLGRILARPKKCKEKLTSRQVHTLEVRDNKEIDGSSNISSSLSKHSRNHTQDSNYCSPSSKFFRSDDHSYDDRSYDHRRYDNRSNDHRRYGDRSYDDRR